MCYRPFKGQFTGVFEGSGFVVYTVGAIGKYKQLDRGGTVSGIVHVFSRQGWAGCMAEAKTHIQSSSF